MSQVIRYKVKPAFAADNETLIRAVFEELHRVNPDGFRYESYIEEDGVSFVHVVGDDVGDGPSPLLDLAAFQRFQHGIAERCEVAPVRVSMREIGSYGHGRRRPGLERAGA